jgi:hypothetical protein
MSGRSTADKCKKCEGGLMDIKDGLYLFYIKDKEIYPVILSQKQWESLQILGNVVSDPIKVLDKSTGTAVGLFDTK